MAILNTPAIVLTMNSTIPVQMNLPASFFLEQESAIDQLLIFSDWDAPASEADLQSAIELMKPVGCVVDLIRIGGTGDGAYLIPDLLSGVEACFSPGVSDVMTFETELAQRFGIPSYLCDASVEAKDLKLMDGLMHFEPLWLGSFTGGNTTTLDSWASRSSHGDGSSLLLQMDIEGAEFNTLLACSDELLSRFRIAVIEFHFLSSLASARFLQMKFMPVFHKLLRHFDVVHAHANNCCGSANLANWDVPQVIELTFLRKSDNQGPRKPPVIPHPLDVVNVPELPPLLLSEAWRAGGGHSGSAQSQELDSGL